MDRKYILLICIVAAVFREVHAELDQNIVRKNSGSSKRLADKYSYSGAEKSSSLAGKNKQSDWESVKPVKDNEKYTEDKSSDYGSKDPNTQYESDSSSSSHGSHWDFDTESGYKSDYNGGENNQDKKTSKDYGNNDQGNTKDTYSTSQYSSATKKTDGVSCSFGVKFIAHPTECTKFYQCAHSKPFLFTCPSSLYFNTNLDVCDWPSNVDCSNDYSDDQNDKTSYEPTKTYKQNYGPKYQQSYQYKSKHMSDVRPRMMAPPAPAPMDPPPMYETIHYDQKPKYQKPMYYYIQSKPEKESSKSGSKDQPMSFPFPMTSHQFLPISSFHFPVIPVMQYPYIPLQSDHNIYKPKQSSEKDSDTSEDSEYDDDTSDKDSEKNEENTYETKKTSSDTMSVPTVSDKKLVVTISDTKTKPTVNDKKSVSTVIDTNSGVKTIKKIIIKKSGPAIKPDVSIKDKSDDKRLYYYYYDDDIKDNNKNDQQSITKDSKNDKQSIIKDSKNYYYLDNSNSNKKYIEKPKMYDDMSKYYYDIGKDYDYGYDYSNGKGRVQHMVSVDKNYNKRNYKPSNKYKKDDQITDEELGFIHFDHKGRGSKSKGKGGDGLGDIGSLLPLLLLGGVNGGQQLLITSLLLSKFKSGGIGGGGGFGGSKSSSGGEKDDLIKKLVLLSLLTGNGNQNVNTPTVNVPNVQVVNGQFVSIATGQPAILIDPVTGQQVTPAQTSVNPATGQLVVTATGNPVFLQDPTTGNLQVAIVGNSLTLQGNPILPPPVARRRQLRRPTQPVNINNNNRFIPLAPTLNTQTTASASGRDAVNLIFLSPLTPSSLPPPIINNDGSATLIRGSLRDILGPNLSNFISNVPLVPGQGLPNSAAGNKQSCNVVRSGETVPFRISPRGGRLLPSECDAIGKLLDKFVPTFLQNFVPSDAAFAGFGSSNKRNNLNINNNLEASSTGSSSFNGVPGVSGSIINANTISTDNTLLTNGSINDFINVRNDHNGCTIAVPNIIPQC